MSDLFDQERQPPRRAIGGHHSASPLNDEWLTPPEIIQALGGWESFDLDPCAPVVRPWPTARQHFTVADNGLLKPWTGRVWVNPPYQTHVIGRWLGRLAEHGQGTSLIFARTETENFFRFVWRAATALLFIEGRLHFHHVDGRRAAANSGAPSVLCAYGFDDAERLGDSGIGGQFVPLLMPRSFAVMALAGNDSWRDVLLGLLRTQGQAVRLDELYHRLADHPKARGRQHWRAQVRKVLQQGPFRRVSPGVWEAAA